MATLTLEGSRIAEGTATNDPNFLEWTLNLSEAPTGPVSVDLRYLSGTAATGVDAYPYTTAERVTFAADELLKTVRFRIDADSLAEVDEAIVLEASNLEGATFFGGTPVIRETSWIQDDDGGGDKLALYVSRPIVREGDSGLGEAVFSVELSRPAPASGLSLDYRTVDGSAKAGEDYVATTGRLNFLSGQTEATIAVPVRGDTRLEFDEGFTLAFDVPAGVAGASFGEAVILDDDTARSTGMPSISIRGSSVLEGSASNDPQFLTWTVTLSEPATGPMSVDLRYLSGTAIAGTDAYAYTSAERITFDAGESSQTVRFRIDADNVAEADETIVLEAFNVEGGAVLAGGGPVLREASWILDDDGTANKLAVDVSKPVIKEGARGTLEAVFEVALSRPAPQDFTLDWRTVDGSAKAGEDYVAASGLLRFAEGQTETSVTVAIKGDRKLEASEGFALVFDRPAGVAEVSLGEATILDDDAGRRAGTPSVSIRGSTAFEHTATNDPEFLTWTISLSQPATGQVTVDLRYLSGTATAGSDAYAYTSANSVTFDAGENSKTVRYRIDADSVAEPDETIVLEAYRVTGAAALSGNAPVLREASWILDDDGTLNKLAIFVSNPLVSEGPDGTRQAVFDIELSRPSPADMVLRYRTVDGSADAGADYRAASGRIQLAEGQTVASVVVPIRSDARLERAEDFSLVVTAPGSVAAVSRGEARILDGSITGDAGANNLRGTAAADAIFGLGGNDTLRGLGGNDAMDGGAGNDRLFGDAGADRLAGGSGNDSLNGGAGNDRLSGGGGRDQLNGGTGGDMLVGGGAGDRFVFQRVADSSGRSRDTIADLDRGADRIVLSGIDADTGVRGNQRFDFIGRAQFDDEPGQLRYARGILQGDVDGDGRADLQVELPGVARLADADFVL